MRVGLNATCFNDRPSGAKQRFLGIYGALFRRCRDVEFVIYEPADCRVGAWFAGEPNVRARRTPIPSSGRLRRILRGAVWWRRALREDRLDLFENFHLPMVKAPACPTVLTMHDVRDGLPGSPPVKRTLYRAILRRALRQSAHVITVSSRMAEELRAYDPACRVTTVYNGLDPEPFRSVTPADAEATRVRLGLPRGFLLTVGHLEPRKNHVRLVEAVALLRDRGMPVPLVIVGNDAGEGEAVAREIARLGLADLVHIRTGVGDTELAHLYALCAAVVFPSRYEGFGIPLLEAMAARRPLILSDIPVFRELTEGQGVYVPADDGAAMADGIAATLASPGRQRGLVAYGDRRLASFAFPALAAEVEQVYRATLAGPAA